jgi:hypothetical protein
MCLQLCIRTGHWPLILYYTQTHGLSYRRKDKKKHEFYEQVLHVGSEIQDASVLLGRCLIRVLKLKNLPRALHNKEEAGTVLVQTGGGGICKQNTLVLLCTGAIPCPKIFSFIVVYRFLIVFNSFRKLVMQKMRKEHRQKSAKIWKCGRSVNFKIIAV